MLTGAEATYVQEGKRIDYTPSGAAVVAGQVVLSNGLVGVATEPIADGALGSIALEGVFECKKEASLVVALGDDIFWDDTANEADKTNTNVFMGKAVAASAAADTTVLVKLGTPEGA